MCPYSATFVHEEIPYNQYDNDPNDSQAPPWNQFIMHQRDDYTKANEFIMDSIDFILESPNSCNGMEFGWDAGEQHQSYQELLSGSGFNNFYYSSNRSEFEGTTISQHLSTPSAPCAPPHALSLTLGYDISAEIDSESEGTYSTDETRSQFEQFPIPCLSINPADLHCNGESSVDYQLRSPLWSQPSLCSSVDTISTSSVRSFDEEAFVDSDRNISSPKPPNPLKTQKKKDLCTGKETLHHNRKAVGDTGTRVTKQRKKSKSRKCIQCNCKQDFSDAELK